MEKQHAKTVSIYILIAAFLVNFTVQAQTETSWTKEKATKWYTSREWLNGLQSTPSEHVNVEEFAKQYHSNKAAWDKAFLFLKNTDFSRLRAGKYPIDDETVYATISEGPPREISNSKFESHLNYVDIHYVIKGKEQIGIVPVAGAKINQDYSATKDIAFYTSDAGKFYVLEPGMFFIATPKDAHNPSNKVDSFDTVKKVVVKVRTTQ